ncbi:MAG: LCP family protein [Oscillospiraceae bacterium]|nr:LCP family protein [Oscillospiraceae bacterium]
MKKAHITNKTKYTIAAALLVAAIIMIAASVVINNVRPPKSGGFGGIVRDQQVYSSGLDRRDGFFTLLVVGIDAASNSTDTIMLVSFDTELKKMSMMSIPRDTITNTRRANKKINASYVSNGKRIRALYDEVESVTGVRPDKYALVTVDGFVELIDSLGGVEVDVPIDMIYEDPTQDLKINIKKGLQTLDGYDAMGFMRYRKTYAEGDIGRIKVQHTFVNAFVDKMLTPSTFVKIPEIAETISENVETDLTLGNEIWLGRQMLSMNLEQDFETFTLPGRAHYYEGLSYYFPIEEEVLNIVNEYFNPYTVPIQELDLFEE